MFFLFFFGYSVSGSDCQISALYVCVGVYKVNVGSLGKAPRSVDDDGVGVCRIVC